MFPVDALTYIPQRPPFVFVDRILECDGHVVKTDFRIPETHQLVGHGVMLAAGVMEHIAQSCAAYIGWQNRENAVRMGVIGSVSNWQFQRAPKVGDTLLTTIAVSAQIFDATVVQAETQCNGSLIAQCDMKVFLV